MYQFDMGKELENINNLKMRVNGAEKDLKEKNLF